VRLGISDNPMTTIDSHPTVSARPPGPLSAGTSLARLDISDNPMTGEIAADLAAALRRHGGLRALNLNDTGLGDEGIAMLAEAVAGAAHELEVGLACATDLVPPLNVSNYPVGKAALAEAVAGQSTSWRWA
jgi:hypothetical protein